MSQQILETDTTMLVDQVINDFFERSITNATLIDSSYRHLWETLYGIIRSGGKRLRPKMTVTAYAAFGGKDLTSVIPVAAAQELLHFSLLIHDDIIDRDYIRHGVLNVAGRYQKSYASFVPKETERTHYANSAAILGGDLMISGAYQLITQSTLPDSDRLIAHDLLSRTIFEVAGGELLDTESSFVPYTLGDAITIARYKTAGYSFITPLVTGARLAGASSQQISILTNYACALGIAFQLVDDILGIFGSEDETGKTTSGDIREGKRTFMVEQALQTLSGSDRESFDSLFANPEATAEEIEHVRYLLISSGARAKTEMAIAKYADEARTALRQLRLGEHHQEQLEKLIIKVTERTS